MKRITILFFILLFVCQFANAKTYKTVRRGNWNSSNNWYNSSIPPNSCSDTIIIKHYIDFDRDLFLLGGAYLQIDSNAGLCGHHNITVNSNAMLYKYGMLQLDTMFIPGGKVIIAAPKDAIFSRYAILTIQGASLETKGASLQVGPWFQCSGGEYQSSIYRPNLRDIRTIYPNPNNGKFTVNLFSTGISNTLKLMDMNGREILVEDIMGDSEDIDMSTLCEGIYYWQLISGDQVIDKGKISLVR